MICVAKYKSVLDSIEKEKSETTTLPSLLQRSLSVSDGERQVTPRLSSKLNRKSFGDDYSPANVWDDAEDATTNSVFNYSPQIRSDNNEGSSVCSSLGSASDLHNIDEKTTHFLGTEGTLHPPTMMHLSQAIDVSEQVMD